MKSRLPKNYEVTPLEEHLIGVASEFNRDPSIFYREDSYYYEDKLVDIKEAVKNDYVAYVDYIIHLEMDSWNDVTFINPKEIKSREMLIVLLKHKWFYPCSSNPYNNSFDASYYINFFRNYDSEVTNLLLKHKRFIYEPDDEDTTVFGSEEIIPYVREIILNKLIE